MHFTGTKIFALDSAVVEGQEMNKTFFECCFAYAVHNVMYNELHILIGLNENKECVSGNRSENFR